MNQPVFHGMSLVGFDHCSRGKLLKMASLRFGDSE